MPTNPVVLAFIALLAVSIAAQTEHAYSQLLNARTTIVYQIPQSGIMTITLFNVLGGGKRKSLLMILNPLEAMKWPVTQVISQAEGDTTVFRLVLSLRSRKEF